MFKHTRNPSPHTEKYIMLLRTLYVSWIFLLLIFVPIFEPKILQQHASVFVNNTKKASTCLWLTFQIWPQFPSSSYHAVPSTLGVDFSVLFLTPVSNIWYFNPLSSEYNTSKKWKIYCQTWIWDVLDVQYVSSFQFVDLLRAATMRNNSNLLSIHINNLRKVLFWCISFVVV